jgi:hypothetical protein
MTRSWRKPLRRWRRLSRGYHLIMARQEIQALGLRVPSGAWVCQDCRLVLWDQRSFIEHGLVHAG